MTFFIEFLFPTTYTSNHNPTNLLFIQTIIELYHKKVPALRAGTPVSFFAIPFALIKYIGQIIENN